MIVPNDNPEWPLLHSVSDFLTFIEVMRKASLLSADEADLLQELIRKNDKWFQELAKKNGTVGGPLYIGEFENKCLELSLKHFREGGCL
jgi:hypothetical protein